MTATNKKRTRRSVAAQSAHLKKRVLEAYADTCTVTAACQKAGVGRRTFYDWVEADSQFASDVSDVESQVADKLEGEAVRRALEGSDTLLIFLLKGHRPERYKERVSKEHSGRNQTPIPIAPKFKSPEDWAAWAGKQHNAR